MPQYALHFGFDPGLANTGMAALLYRGNDDFPARIRSESFSSESKLTREARCSRLSDSVHRFIASVFSEFPDIESASCACEDVLHGIRFRRADMGMAVAAISIGVAHCKAIGLIRWLNPRDIKHHACPDWPGWSKHAWKHAGNTGKFKASMPDKEAMAESVARKFHLRGIDSDHVIDAIMAASLDRKFFLAD